MNDFQEKLWPSFHAEVTEQLEAIELVLVADHSRAPPDVDALFRQFHTIKGGCGMMGYLTMQDIAHAVEDLLDPLRKAGAALGREHVDLLLQALDTLTRQLQEVEETRRNPAPNNALLEKLRALGDSAAATTPAAEPAPAEDRPRPEEPAPPAADAALDFTGAEMASFAELCRSLLPLLVLGKLEAADGQQDALQTLQKLALEHGLQAIASMLSRPAASAEHPDARLAFYGELVDRLAWLERIGALDCGVRDTAMLVRMQYGDRLSQASADAGEAVTRLAADLPRARVPEAAREAGAACATLHALSLLMQLPATTRLTRLVRQLLREIQRRQPAHHDGLYELAMLAVRMPQQLVPMDGETPDFAQMCDSLHEQLRQLSALVAEQDAPADVAAAIRQALDIPEEVLAGLSAKSLRELRQAVEQKKRIAMLVADPESQGDAGERFMDWLRRNSYLISSETIFDGSFDQHLANATRHRFLIAFDTDADQVQQQLDALYSGPHFYDLTLFYYQGETRPRQASAAGRRPQTGSTLRIDSGALDQFVNRVGELVMLRNQMNHYLHDEALAAQSRSVQRLLRQRDEKRPLSAEEMDQLRELLQQWERRDQQLAQTDQRLQTALERMQEDALALRVVPIGMVFNRFPRVVRDIGIAQNKQVQLQISGEAVRIDKSLLEILVDPLMHMIRNAVDHGIEPPEERQRAGKPVQATLRLAARQQGNTLFVEVGDDGRGLDKDRIRARALKNDLASEADLQKMDEHELFNLIFQPGFSTSEQVTDVSGRGVGMDVVKSRVAQLGGQVEIRSVPGQGSSFTLRLPLSAAIQTVVLVAAGRQRIAIPERNVSEVISLRDRQLTSVQNQACMMLRGHTLPVYRLDVLLGHDHEPAVLDGEQEVVVLTDGTFRLGLMVDSVLGRPEIFIRDVHPGITSLSGIGGVSVLGDGSLVIIADCENLFELAMRKAQSLKSLVRA